MSIFFYPNQFTAGPGEKIAVHLMNKEYAGAEHNIAFALSPGLLAWKAPYRPMKRAISSSRHRTTPGDYTFWCYVGEHKELGMQGTLTVADTVAQAAETTTASLHQRPQEKWLNLWLISLPQRQPNRLPQA